MVFGYKTNSYKINNYRNYRTRKNTPGNIPTSTSDSRCKKTFIKKDYDIDINELKSSNIKLDSTTANYINEYKKAKNDYEKKSGWFNTGKKCIDYINISNTKEKQKYTSKIANCNTYAQNKQKNQKLYIESFTKYIKEKIIVKLKKVLENPNEKQMTKFACYIQILSQLNNRLSISSIIQKFLSLYNEKDDIKNGARNYIEYLLMNNKSITDEFLKTYKTLFTYKNTKFIDAFSKAIDN